MHYGRRHSPAAQGHRVGAGTAGRQARGRGRARRSPTTGGTSSPSSTCRGTSWPAGSARARRPGRSGRQRRSRLGLINSVEVAAVLPYHLWDIAERLALLSGPARRQSAILRDLDVSDPDVQVVLAPQRRAHELAVADIERRIGRLEEFAVLAAGADAARKRRRALEELAELNADYEDLLVRLDDPENALTTAGRPADELRALAAEADDAVRRANEAGRGLVIPPPAAG